MRYIVVCLLSFFCAYCRPPLNPKWFIASSVRMSSFFSPNGRFVEKKPFKMKGILKKTCYAHSRNNFQAALWRKDALQTLLRRHENPWQFEKKRQQALAVHEGCHGCHFFYCSRSQPFALSKCSLQRCH